MPQHNIFLDNRVTIIAFIATRGRHSSELLGRGRTVANSMVNVEGTRTRLNDMMVRMPITANIVVTIVVMMNGDSFQQLRRDLKVDRLGAACMVIATRRAPSKHEVKAMDAGCVVFLTPLHGPRSVEAARLPEWDLLRRTAS